MAVTFVASDDPQQAILDPLRVRWLGRATYSEVWDLQKKLFPGSDDYLLLVEHEPVFTMGVRTDESNLLTDPSELDAEVVRTNRGGDITFHGPGQLVGYPVLSVPGRRGGGMADTVAYVNNIEQILIDTLNDFGLRAGRVKGCPGVWIDSESPEPRKIAAIGVRLSRGRSMHGFALNIDTDLAWYDHIVPCGLADKPVTSMAAEGVTASLKDVTNAVVRHTSKVLTPGRGVDRQDVVWRHSVGDLSPFSRGQGPGEVVKPAQPKQAVKETPTSTVAVELKPRKPSRLEGRLDEAGVTGGLEIGSRKPDWMRVKLRTDKNYLKLKQTARDLSLTTVCEEAGCPNIFDCWNEGTATFMLLGDRCTRKCGFCLIDTRKPHEVDTEEPQRVADGIRDLGINFAVLTMVARDDLIDGGAAIVAKTVEAIHATAPGVGVEVLISDLQGSSESLQTVCDSQPEIVNHNIETVARLQRAVRPSASYSRSLALLARAKERGMTTKSGIIVGMGESNDEVESTLADLAAVGVDIVTIGQYLRPTSNHLAIQRWVTPEEFDHFKSVGEKKFGISHVESAPLTRSSHHAGSVANGLGT